MNGTQNFGLPPPEIQKSGGFSPPQNCALALGYPLAGGHRGCVTSGGQDGYSRNSSILVKSQNVEAGVSAGVKSWGVLSLLRKRRISFDLRGSGEKHLVHSAAVALLTKMIDNPRQGQKARGTHRDGTERNRGSKSARDCRCVEPGNSV